MNVPLLSSELVSGRNAAGEGILRNHLEQLSRPGNLIPTYTGRSALTVEEFS